METKDHKKIEKINKYDLKGIQPKTLSGGYQGDAYLNQKDGIVKVMRESFQSEDEYLTVQEQHNANHVLYYLSMIADAAIRGRSTGDDREKIRRMKEHMRNLYEFIGEKRVRLRSDMTSLLCGLEKLCPGQRQQLMRFVYENWGQIRSFAEAYGHHERCFSEDKFLKIKDVVFRRCCLRAWWWRIQSEKCWFRFRKLLKRVKK